MRELIFISCVVCVYVWYSAVQFTTYEQLKKVRLLSVCTEAFREAVH